MSEPDSDPLFGPAVLKLSFIMKGIVDQPGFRVVYHGTIRDLGVTDSQVNKYITRNRERLEAHINSKKGG